MRENGQNGCQGESNIRFSKFPSPRGCYVLPSFKYAICAYKLLLTKDWIENSVTFECGEHEAEEMFIGI